MKELLEEYWKGPLLSATHILQWHYNVKSLNLHWRKGRKVELRKQKRRKS